MAATSPLALPAADVMHMPGTGRHQAAGTAARNWQPGRHRVTGRGHLPHPLVVSRPARFAPTAGGRPAPLAAAPLTAAGPLTAPGHRTAAATLTAAGPLTAVGGRHRASGQLTRTAEPVLTLAGDGRHRALGRAAGRDTAAAAGRPHAGRPAVRVAAALTLAAVLLPLSAGPADAAPRSASAQAGTAPTAPLAELPGAPAATPTEPADLRWPTLGIAMALLLGISITGSTAVLLLRPAREPGGRH
jgi:hypothetical protein